MSYPGFFPTNRRALVACACFCILAASGLLFAASALPQNAELQQRLADAKQVAAENKQKLLQYHWTETTQVTLKGDPKPLMQESCQYGPDGQVQRTPLASTPQQPMGGGLTNGAAATKETETQDYMQDVNSVLALYVPPDPQRMEQSNAAGKVSLSPVLGGINLIFTDYAQPGDKMRLLFDTTDKKIMELDVDTYMGEAKDAVTLQIQMGTLPDGGNYPHQATVTAPAKDLTVTTTNWDYQKL